MILDTLNNKPEIGIVTSVGSVGIEVLGILNPILSFLSLCIGLSVGVITLYLQINKLRRK